MAVRVHGGVPRHEAARSRRDRSHGRHLVDLALRSGDSVTALVCDPTALGGLIVIDTGGLPVS
ncbi:hypothetical protein [Streptomyces sp. NPDC000878]